jgi:hypothetical protein
MAAVLRALMILVGVVISFLLYAQEAAQIEMLERRITFLEWLSAGEKPPRAP